MFAAFFEMWRLVREELGEDVCDKGDTLYYRWYRPEDPGSPFYAER